MNRLLYTLCIIMGLMMATQSVWAQVGEIKEKAGQSQSGDGFNGGGWDFAFELFIDFFLWMPQYQRKQLSRKEAFPEIISIDLLPHIGIGENRAFLFIPRVRGNWGLFSTDFRYSNLASDGTFKTYDWQILQFNFVNEPGVTFRLGTGFMYEEFTETMYNENTVGLDLRWKDNKISNNSEFRIAHNFNNGDTPRWELGTRLNYKIIDLGRFDGYITAGVMFQKYYKEVNVWSGVTGLSFNLH